MPWVRIDDHFDEHPKLAAVGPLGWGVWLAGIAYCNRNLTDGFIPRNKAFSLCSFEYIDHHDRIWELSRTSGMEGDNIEPEWVVDMLVHGGLWDSVDGGYKVHDYSDFQPTKKHVLEERAKKQAAGKAGGQASARARAEASAQAHSKPVPVPKPVPKNHIPPDGKKKAPRKTQLPEDWTPDAELLAWAKTNHADVDAAFETLQFRDHFIAKGETRVDWNRSFQTWIRNQSRWSKPKHLQTVPDPTVLCEHGAPAKSCWECRKTENGRTA